MAEDRRLDILQEEIKLMKGELKQSLASVRDYLLNMELPSYEISHILSALGNEGTKVTMKGSLETPSQEKPPAEPEDTLTETEESLGDEVPEGDDLLDLENPAEDEAETNPEDSLTDEDGELPPEDTQSVPEDDSTMPEDASSAPDEPGPYEQDESPPFEPEMSRHEEQPIQDEQPVPEEQLMQEEQPMPEEQSVRYENTMDDVSLSVPKVNMLANLINWVARANKEIGRDQIPTFLEVYGISGYLSPELKDVILHLLSLIHI